MAAVDQAASTSAELIGLAWGLPLKQAQYATAMFSYANDLYLQSFGGRKAKWTTASSGDCHESNSRPIDPTLGEPWLSARSAVRCVGVGLAKKCACDISRVFQWAVAEQAGRDAALVLMPLDQLSLHRQAICAWLRSRKGQGNPPPAMPSGAVLKEEGAVPPMPPGAYVKDEEVGPPPMPPGAFFKEEGAVPPMPPDAVVKQEHEVVVQECSQNGRTKRQRSQ